LVLFSSSNAAANSGRDGKLNSHLMASCVRNIRTKAIETNHPFRICDITMAFYAPSVVGFSYSGYLGRELTQNYLFGGVS